jgi:DNA-binding PadR family transcriptional regulator
MLTKMLAEPQREWTAQGLGAVAGVAESTSYDALKAMQSVGWVSSRLEGVSEHQGRQPRGPRLTYWRLTDLGRREAG